MLLPIIAVYLFSHFTTSILVIPPIFGENTNDVDFAKEKY